MLGSRTYDITTRSLVMGILNRTTDSFYDKGAFFEMDAFLRRADQLVTEGADLLDVGGGKAGPGPQGTAGGKGGRGVPPPAGPPPPLGGPPLGGTGGGA